MKPFRSLLPAEAILASRLDPETPIGALKCDSTAIGPGDCFFALAGHTTDGHRFVEQARARGAAAIVVEQPAAFQDRSGIVLVRSTRESLGIAASRWYGEPSRAFRLAGITGTNGKTTTTFLLKGIWEALGATSGIVGTVEYHIGQRRRASPLTTPDPLLLQSLFSEMVAENVGYVALEVSSIALDQARVAGSVFDTALFTNLTQDHLDYHHDMEHYFLAKRRLFEEYRPRVAVFNTDDPYGRRLHAEFGGGRLGFSLSPTGADFTVSSAIFEKSSTTAELQTPYGRFTLRTGLIGKHNLYNAIGAAAVACGQGFAPEGVIAALAGAGGAPGRLERVPGRTGRDPHVFVDYAHTDDALRNVLASLRELRADAPGKILTVFGCGGDRDRGKRPLMGEIASRYSDVTIATSDNPRTEDPAAILDDIEAGVRRGETEYHRETDRARAIALALDLAGPEDLVLVAGKGHETYQILGTDRIPFDDRAVVRGIFARRGGFLVR